MRCKQPHNTVTTIQPRFNADNARISTSQEQIVDEDVLEKIKILYSRKGYSNPTLSSEDEAYAGDKNIRKRKRPLKILGKDFNPYGSYTIKHSNGTLTYVFPSPKISSPKTSTIKPFVVYTNPATLRSKRKVYDEPLEAYPSKLIDQIMDKHINSFQGAFENDSLDGDLDQLKQRNDISSDTFICDSIDKMVEPEEGITKTNSSVMIVNTETRRQRVRIETCRNEGKPCMFCVTWSTWSTRQFVRKTFPFIDNLT